MSMKSWGSAWTAEEDEMLCELYLREPRDELEVLFNRPFNGIRKRAAKLGLRRCPDMVAAGRVETLAAARSKSYFTCRTCFCSKPSRARDSQNQTMCTTCRTARRLTFVVTQGWPLVRSFDIQAPRGIHVTKAI